MSKGAAALSMDKKFIQGRQKQVRLQLAELGSCFGQVDLFKIRGKFALSDAHEDHFILPKGKILMMTHSRVILLQQPSNIVAQRKFNPARDPCSVLWDVWQWDDLLTMELTHGKKDHPNASPSRLLLYLNIKSTEVKENVRIITCNHDTHQALEVYSSIERARNTYRTYSIKGNSEKESDETIFTTCQWHCYGSMQKNLAFGLLQKCLHQST